MMRDPLPSWNDGATKRTIVDFVNRITVEGSPDYVAVSDRVALFDNDGKRARQRRRFKFASPDAGAIRIGQHDGMPDPKIRPRLLDGTLTPGVAQGQDEGLLLDRPVKRARSVDEHEGPRFFGIFWPLFLGRLRAH